MKSHYSRRDFLKLAGLGLGSLAFQSPDRLRPLPQFPAGDSLGRVLAKVDVKAAPNDDINTPTVSTLYEDAVVEWAREVVPSRGLFNVTYINQRFVETPGGFIRSSFVQPVKNSPNAPLTAMPEGKTGFWAEVTVPFVDLILDGPAISPWVKDRIVYNLPPRLYYSQIAWIDQIRVDGATTLYRFNEDPGHGYGYGDIFWADGAGFRPLTQDDVSPINPEVDPAIKKVYVDATSEYQTLQCFEGTTEVYFCRISTGYKSENFATPLGEQTTWRKALSIHMAGGTTGAGFDTPAIPWTTLFNPAGMAVHGAFWHNDFGTPRSHGCVNAHPEDAKWVFRWTNPNVTLEQSDITLEWPNGGTHVIVDEERV
ncbi:MAG TPA: L,D-transpeptidase [Anaerolineales bacterium]|jgi:lipoprotein-anchoring transpeptidase ErfK/SrfK